MKPIIIIEILIHIILNNGMDDVKQYIHLLYEAIGDDITPSMLNFKGQDYEQWLEKERQILLYNRNNNIGNIVVQYLKNFQIEEYGKILLLDDIKDVYTVEAVAKIKDIIDYVYGSDIAHYYNSNNIDMRYLMNYGTYISYNRVSKHNKMNETKVRSGSVIRLNEVSSIINEIAFTKIEKILLISLLNEAKFFGTTSYAYQVLLDRTESKPSNYMRLEWGEWLTYERILKDIIRKAVCNGEFILNLPEYKVFKIQQVISAMLGKEREQCEMELIQIRRFYNINYEFVQSVLLIYDIIKIVDSELFDIEITDSRIKISIKEGCDVSIAIEKIYERCIRYNTEALLLVAAMVHSTESKSKRSNKYITWQSCSVVEKIKTVRMIYEYSPFDEIVVMEPHGDTTIEYATDFLAESFLTMSGRSGVLTLTESYYTMSKNKFIKLAGTGHNIADDNDDYLDKYKNNMYYLYTEEVSLGMFEEIAHEMTSNEISNEGIHDSRNLVCSIEAEFKDTHSFGKLLDCIKSGWNDNKILYYNEKYKEVINMIIERNGKIQDQIKELISMSPIDFKLDSVTTVIAMLLQIIHNKINVNKHTSMYLTMLSSYSKQSTKAKGKNEPEQNKKTEAVETIY